MIHLGILIISLVGFGLLALSMDRHQEHVFRRALTTSTSRALRWGGWLALLAALTVSVRGYGWSLGLVAYSGHTSAAAALVFLILLVRLRNIKT